ncbi:fungal-specific transcription factor domain-containing protein [Dactylonectria macrodidyma]|uniref:Fungal-specific transcription factor domain-containing protein n=1 Tax=Dactylonectria macrodidyma TaxID=307937 RepID=A0A9P9II88_9HYPO|nr:fungal-specific transcription factor domain-containing protein [Dactylonectria macrodidyma]
MPSMYDSRQGYKVSKRRSIQACLSCRSRKVRCDVSSRGQPCTNCSLDDKQCHLAGGTTLLRQPICNQRSPQHGRDLNCGFPQQHTPSSDEVRTPGLVFEPEVAITNSLLDSTNFESPQGSLGHLNAVSRSICPDIPAEHFLASQEGSSGPTFLEEYGTLPLALDKVPIGTATSRDDKPGMVLYSHYRFLVVSNLHAIPHQDVSYLEAQSCLHVPIRPILDVFLEKFFTHIHLFLPLIDEGDFWEMYSPNSHTANDDTTSLLVLQAMLFSSCCFVSLEVVKRLGFSDVRTARAEFYRRTKLLYDLESESAHLPMAQSALLLMGWVPQSVSTTSPSPFRTWLSLAIQHAKHINSDRYAETGDTATAMLPVQKRQCKALRRLWWCCIILDRLSPLCTRFRHQITQDRFDIQHCVPLGFADLQHEIHRSRIFSPATKRRHILLFSTFLKLIIILTDVLSIAFPMESTAQSDTASVKHREACLDKCDGLLNGWYRTASAEFPPNYGDHRDQPDDLSTKSVILHTNLMYIYYYTSRIVFCNYKVFSQLSASSRPAMRQIEGERAKDGIAAHRGVEDATLGLIKCIETLTYFQLTSWLPIPAVACIATPLALHVVTARLSSPSRGLALEDLTMWPQTILASDQSRLDVLVAAINTFSPQYYGVDWVEKTAKHVADLAQTYNQAWSRSGQDGTKDWRQILANHPDTYLRLTWTVDLCISKRRLPEEQDFPPWLLNELDRDKELKPPSLYRGSLIPSTRANDNELEQIFDFADLPINFAWDEPAAGQDENAEAMAWIALSGLAP